MTNSRLHSRAHSSDEQNPDGQGEQVLLLVTVEPWGISTSGASGESGTVPSQAHSQPAAQQCIISANV
jgi:hypothetical protein